MPQEDLSMLGVSIKSEEFAHEAQEALLNNFKLAIEGALNSNQSYQIIKKRADQKIDNAESPVKIFPTNDGSASGDSILVTYRNPDSGNIRNVLQMHVELNRKGNEIAVSTFDSEYKIFERLSEADAISMAKDYIGTYQF